MRIRGPQEERKHPYVRIPRPRIDEWQYLQILGEELWSVETHFSFNRTVPCTYRINDCIGCQAKRGKRIKLFLTCYDPLKRELALLEVTNCAIGGCNSFMNEANSWRGKRIGYQRWRHNRGHLAISYSEPSPGWPRPQNLPPTFLPYFVWNRIWDVNYTDTEWRKISGLDRSYSEILEEIRLENPDPRGDQLIPRGQFEVKQIDCEEDPPIL